MRLAYSPAGTSCAKPIGIRFLVLAGPSGLDERVSLAYGERIMTGPMRGPENAGMTVSASVLMGLGTTTTVAV